MLRQHAPVRPLTAVTWTRSSGCPPSCCVELHSVQGVACRLAFSDDDSGVLCVEL